ncbi:MAG: glucan ABC transporter ATP-binding protein/ permease [Hyphomicrobiaceae bacterium]|nr:glucan ABC transporter ATP-binding protein/ permease [Hyphomicrobiaceae bacterium]
MQLLSVYRRVLSLLTTERSLALKLAGANAVIGLVQLAEPLLFGQVVDALARNLPAGRIIMLWAILGLFGILASVVVAVAADRLAHRQRLAAMARAFDHAITLPISYHADRGTGAVVRTIIAGASSLFGTWLTIMREQISALTTVIFLAPVAFWMEWRLALLLTALAGVYAFLNAFVVKRTSRGQEEVERHHVEVSGRVGDVISNVTIVQSYARLTREASALRSKMDHLLAAQYPVLTWWGVLTVLSRAAGTITMVAIFALGAYLAQSGQITVGEIVTFVGFASLLIGKLDQLSSFVSRLFMEAPTLQTYFDLLDARHTLSDADKNPPLPTVTGHVTYDNVSFRYGSGAQGVFDLKFEVLPGRTVALVGPTGSGKTTTLALLQRLRDPDHGNVLIDGVDIRKSSITSLREAIGTVFQDAGLFNRSIYENILIGRPEATEADVWEAARMAQAADFIKAKPGGMSFVAGERGASLSGGERQRIAIARAILKNAPILILDEATSALDTQTEAQIKRALDAVRKGRTTFIIAHRLSTVADADEILVLDQGRIIERGTFAALVAQRGLFAKLVAEGDFYEPASDDDAG